MTQSTAKTSLDKRDDKRHEDSPLKKGLLSSTKVEFPRCLTQSSPWMRRRPKHQPQVQVSELLLEGTELPLPKIDEAKLG